MNMFVKVESQGTKVKLLQFLQIERLEPEHA